MYWKEKKTKTAISAHTLQAVSQQHMHTKSYFQILAAITLRTLLSYFPTSICFCFSYSHESSRQAARNQNFHCIL